MRSPDIAPRAAVLAIAVGLVAGASPVTAEEPLSVVYGPRALASEGDPDYREALYLRVPATPEGLLHLRVFDADASSANDLAYGAGFDTETRFAIFGGAGAGAADRPGGIELGARTVGPSAAFDNSWQTIASFRPDQGDHVGDAFLFRLEVTGAAGDDANLFAATLSRRERRNLPPAGLWVTNSKPTLRIPDARRVTEVKLDLPPDVARITVHDFDTAAGRLAFASPVRTLPLPASGQNDWRRNTVDLLPEERGVTASLTVAGGQEIPNDTTLFVTDEAGRVLPMRMDAKAWAPNRRPLAVADQAPLADCSGVAFDASRSSDPDGQGLRYRWDFGDGAVSDEVAIVHRYPHAGVYLGALRVFDSSGQVGNGASLPFQVVVKRPPQAVAGDDVVVAPGETVRFDGSASTAGDRPIASYGWDFGDGTRASGPSVSRTFAESGRYTIALEVRDDQPGACDSSSDRVVVDVNAPPVAVAGGGRPVAVGEPVRLDGSRSYDVDGEIASWSWDLGDGASADGRSVAHAYARPGTYLARLTVRDSADLANSTTSAVRRVVVNDPPIAAAGADRLAAVGELVVLDGRGSADRDGRLIDHAWNFGDGGKGRGAQVRYAFDRPGTYRVTLAVTDDSGTTTNSASDTATVVVNAPPIARAGEDQLVTASEVRFDGSRSEDPDGEVATYAWDFGDGTTGSGPRPVHAYRQPGSYAVRLKVTDDSGAIRSSAEDRLQVDVNAAPLADAGPDQLAAPGQELTFSAAGSLDPDGDVDGFAWDFGDGAIAQGETVTHRFTSPGTHQVRLTVRDDTGQANAVGFDDARVVVNAPPVANAGPELLAVPGGEVVLDARNSFDPDGALASFRWHFSDTEEPTTGPVVRRAFTRPGIHSARLTVTDDSGAINAVAQDEVTVRVNHPPVANAGPDLVTASTTVALDGSASADADGDALGYRWDFGDGTPPVSGHKVTHTYAEPGAYPVILTVDDGTGLANGQATAAVTVVIDGPPVADAGGNKEVCAGDVVVLDGSHSRDPEAGLLRYRWDFGDGTGADLVNPTKIYREGGVYPVTLHVADDSGFAPNQGVDRIAVRVKESPIAVAGPDQMACAGGEVRFDGSASRDSDGVVNRFAWNFGDGAPGGGERPVHVYAVPGEYRVTLTIDGDQVGQCASTHADETLVKVVPAPVARIAAPASVGVGDPASFDAAGSDAGVARVVGWRWDFGDGVTAEGQDTTHVYARPGRYVVTLTLATEGGVGACNTVTARHAIVANAAPVAAAGIDQLAGIDQEVLLDGAASRDEDGGIVSYVWDFDNGSTASGVAVRHRFRASGRYDVRLVVTDEAGLPNSRAVDQMTVTVNEPPIPLVEAPPVACPGETVTFRGAGSRDPDGQIARFGWTLGDGAAAKGKDVAHAFKAPGVYDVALTVDDGTGLDNARQQLARPFKVNRPPWAQAGPERRLCAGEESIFDGSASIDWDGAITDHAWDFGDGTVGRGPRVAHQFAVPGVYDVRLTVTDDSGSRCAMAGDVARVFVNPPPTARAGGERKGFVGGAHDELLFDGSGSRAGDGQPLTFLWDFGDGNTLAGTQVRYGFSQPGRYPVRLTVSDGTGLPCGVASEVLDVDVQARE